MTETAFSVNYSVLDGLQMLEKICHKTSEAMLPVLESQVEIKDNIISDPQTYYSIIHKVCSGVLGIVSARKFCTHFDELRNPNEIFEWLKNNLGANCVFVKNFAGISKYEERGLEDFLSWFRSQVMETIDLSDLYELMLSLDFPLDENGFDKSYNHEIENTIGSFYTPAPLADKCVELSLNHYIFQNTGIPKFSQSAKTSVNLDSVYALLENTSFADHCCGTGSFLLAVVQFIKKHFNADKNLLQKAIGNMVAIEADSLALEVTQLGLLSAINRLDLYAKIKTNFIHGNPLIQPRNVAVAANFSSSFYYHNGLAIDAQQLPKSDIILGNPPWVEVGFDYDFFFHTLYPKLNEFEEEQQLFQAVFNLEFSHPKLYNWFINHESANDIAVDQIYKDPRFQHSFMGGLNTNLLFTELADSLSTKRGVVGLVLNDATLSAHCNRKLLRYLKGRNRIVVRFDLINSNKIFNIDEDEEFTVIVLGNNESSTDVHLRNLTTLDEINVA